MPRRLRFTNTKNYERKKQAQKRLAKNNEFVCIKEVCDSVLPSGWKNMSSDSGDEIRLCKVSSPSDALSAEPVKISHTVIIDSNTSWSVYVHGSKVLRRNDTPLSRFPGLLSAGSLQSLITVIDGASVCAGNPDGKFIRMAKAKKGAIKSTSGKTTAILDNAFQVSLNGEVYQETIRTTDCRLLVHGAKCQACAEYRPHLRAMHSRWSRDKGKVSKFSNNRYMNTPQKQRKMKNLQARAYSAEQEVKKLQEYIKSSTEKNGVLVDENLHNDLQAVMTDQSEEINRLFPEGSFRRLFWDEQLKMAKLQNSKNMRWHPMMIRWCLNLKLLSSSAYHALRSSGFLKLPSERTLRDYTHFVKTRPGFQAEVDSMLVREARLSELPEWKKHIVLLLDEMKIKESLVYDKHESNIVGFVNLGEVNDQLARFEREASNNSEQSCGEVATHILTVMVRGIFVRLRFPYAHFLTTGVAGDYIYLIVWEAIERLERLGFKVLVITADGASANRKFFRMHQSTSCSKDDLCYKTTNPYAVDERVLYFVSDVPHLMKTVRNCWSHSRGHRNTRKMWVRSNHLCMCVPVHVSRVQTCIPVCGCTRISN